MLPAPANGAENVRIWNVAKTSGPSKKQLIRLLPIFSTFTQRLLKPASTAKRFMPKPRDCNPGAFRGSQLARDLLMAQTQRAKVEVAHQGDHVSQGEHDGLPRPAGPVSGGGSRLGTVAPDGRAGHARGNAAQHAKRQGPLVEPGQGHGAPTTSPLPPPSNSPTRLTVQSLKDQQPRGRLSSEHLQRQADRLDADALGHASATGINKASVTARVRFPLETARKETRRRPHP